MQTIPSPIPTGYDVLEAPVGSGATNTGLYDVLVGGLPFNLATSPDNPFVRRRVQATAQKLQQASEPGEATLTDWWRSAQSSFHGGAGQMFLEPGVPTPVAKVRFDTSFNIDPFTAGQVTRLPDVTSIYTLPSAETRAFAVSTNYGAGGASQDYALVAQGAVLMRFEFPHGGGAPTSGALSAPAVTSLVVTSMVTDGRAVYCGATWVSGGTPTSGVLRLDALDTGGTPVVIYAAAGAVAVYAGWVKGRLLAARGRSLYELDAGVSAGANAFPAATFTHASQLWEGSGGWASSPTGILCGGTSGGKSDAAELSLTSVAGVPTLTGGSIAFELPPGEQLTALASSSGSFLAVGTSVGVRFGKWNGFTSALEYGPLTVETTAPVYGFEGRARFVYNTATALLPGGESGLACVDLGTQVDDAGRLAWATNLPGDKALTGVSWDVSALPESRQLVFVVGDQVLLEGVGPGSTRPAWIRMSRTRMGTVEPKLFKLGRVRGNIQAGQLSVIAYVPNGPDEDATVLATFANTTVEPEEFRMPAGSREWVALRVSLGGADCVFNSYVISALPAPRWQWEYSIPCILQKNETNRSGVLVTPHLSARQRLEQVQKLVSAGDEVMFVEWDKASSARTLVTVADMEFRQASPPQRDSSFGGVLTLLLRTTEGP